MKFYRYSFRNFHVESTVIGFLLIVFIVGCVSIQEDQSDNRFIVLNDEQNRQKNIDF